MGYLLTLIFGIAVLFSAFSAHAESRIALVIGNGDYESTSPLPNPANDARLISNTLRDLDFEVIEVIDASQKEMKRAIRDFGAALRGQSDDVVSLFYYAGHGVQLSGENYIIPVDARIVQEGDVDLETIRANSILSMMEHSPSRINFVILDACRNNPFARGFRSSSRGLAEMNAPTGSLIAYATAPGDVASDGEGVNSPYTESLVAALQEPGVSVERMFRDVRNRVRAKTKNAQTPWESSSLVGGDFYFRAKEEIVETVPQEEPASQSDETVFWNSVKDSDDPAMLEAYLQQYPEGVFAVLATLKLRGLKTAEQVEESAPETVDVAIAEPEVSQDEPTPISEGTEIAYATLSNNPFSVIMKSGPNPNTRTISYLAVNEKVTILNDLTKKGWVMVRTESGVGPDQVTGWVQVNDITTQQPAERAFFLPYISRESNHRFRRWQKESRKESLFAISSSGQASWISGRLYYAKAEFLVLQHCRNRSETDDCRVVARNGEVLPDYAAD